MDSQIERERIIIKQNIIMMLAKAKELFKGREPELKRLVYRQFLEEGE